MIRHRFATDYETREKQCSKCREWWPADLEFFNRKGSGLHSYCKACVYERVVELRKAKKEETDGRVDR